MTTKPVPEDQEASPAPKPAAQRVFIHEPGWRVGLKIGSIREFCYMMAPGQDYYHRLLDGEIYVYHGDERLCLACADRRGLLSHEARGLRAVEHDVEIENETIGPSGEIELNDSQEGNRFL